MINGLFDFQVRAPLLLLLGMSRGCNESIQTAHQTLPYSLTVYRFRYVRGAWSGDTSLGPWSLALGREVKLTPDSLTRHDGSPRAAPSSSSYRTMLIRWIVKKRAAVAGALGGVNGPWSELGRIPFRARLSAHHPLDALANGKEQIRYT